ncbi:MAG: hypothetical protein R3B06_06750 [Kofleriaceae bacterium]
MSNVRARLTAALVATLAAACSGGGDQPDPTVIGPFDRQVAAADVSILYPLTATTDRDDLIAASAIGAHGVLVPPDVLGDATVGRLDSDVAASDADLRLVALRLDPCSARGSCTPEIRAVFQPVVVVDGRPIAADGALHVFYDVPADELLGFLKQVLALKRAAGAGVDVDRPLGVHPILAARGLRSEFAVGLRAALLAHVGAARIARVTRMVHQFPDGDAWGFALFERRGDRLEAATIVDAQATNQTISGTGAHDPMIGGIYETGVTPSLPALGVLAALGRPATTTPEVEAGFAEAIAAQDPTRHTSEDTDCVSCHVAEGARLVGTTAYGLTPADEFASARPLAYPRDGQALTNLHAFGYLGAQVSVMRRTSHETALTADWFQEALLAE